MEVMIKRSLLPYLQHHLREKEITLLAGPRQAGKTYLMHLLKNDLDKKGEKSLFLNLDTEEDRQFFVSQTALLNKIRLYLGNNHGYVFIDEIQRKTDAGLFLKGIYDLDTPYKFIVSGSGSLELKEKIHESLAGRKRLFEVNPITFIEFVHFRTGYRFERNIEEYFAIEKQKTNDYFQEYLQFGGYPRVILSETIEEKMASMGEIYQSYLERDMISLLHLEKAEALTHLVKILASQIGGLINTRELSSTIGIADKTIKKYLWYLEKTYITTRVSPYFRNVRKEISKSPMYYFRDTGLRNYILGIFNIPITSLSGGHLFENFVINRLREDLVYTSSGIHFWRTRDDAEVDFVIQNGEQLIPIEVKYTSLEKTEVSRSMRNFLNTYSPKQAYVVHMGDKKTISIQGTVIQFVPYTAVLAVLGTVL